MLNSDTTQPTASTDGTVEEIELGEAEKRVLKAAAPEASASPYYYDYSSSYRWKMFVTFAIMAMLTGPMIHNTALTGLLLRNGAYMERCNGNFDTYNPAEPYVKCLAMKQATNYLDSLAFTLIFVFTGVSGVLLDSFGAKICNLVGLSFQLIGWIFMFFSGPNFNGYQAAIIFLSAGVEPTFFGILSIANLFPSNMSTSIAVLGASRSLAAAVPQVAFKIAQSFDSIHLSHVALFFGALILVWATIVAFYLPFQPFPALPSGASLDTTPGPSKISYSKHLNQRPQISWKRFKPEFLHQAKQVWFYARRWPYWVMIGTVLLTFIRQGFYLRLGIRSIMNSDTPRPSLEQIYNIASILSCIPCMALGFFADRYSRSSVICFLMVSGSLTLFTLLFSSLVFDVVSLFFNWLCLSFVASQFYCYVGFCYPQRQMGTLVGFSFTVSALLALIPLFPAVSRAEGFGTFAMSSSILAVFCLLGAVGAVLLYWNVERPLLLQARVKKQVE